MHLLDIKVAVLATQVYYTSLELGWRNRLGVVGIQVIFKGMRLDGITRSEKIRQRTEPQEPLTWRGEASQEPKKEQPLWRRESQATWCFGIHLQKHMREKRAGRLSHLHIQLPSKEFLEDERFGVFLWNGEMSSFSLMDINRKICGLRFCLGYQ